MPEILTDEMYWASKRPELRSLWKFLKYRQDRSFTNYTQKNFNAALALAEQMATLGYVGPDALIDTPVFAYLYSPSWVMQQRTDTGIIANPSIIVPPVYNQYGVLESRPPIYTGGTVPPLYILTSLDPADYPVWSDPEAA